MTDTKNKSGGESAEQEDVLNIEGAPQTDTWQDELPPEDDFHDQGEFHDDLQEDIVEETLAAEAYDDVPASDAEAPKRGKGFLVIVVALVCAVGGGLAYLQFGGGSNTGTSSPLVPASAVLNLAEINKVMPADSARTPESMNQRTETTEAVDMSKMFKAGAGETKVLPGQEASELTAEKPPLNVATEILSTTAVPPLPQNSVPPVLDSAKAVEKATSDVLPPPLDKEHTVAKVETIPMPPSADKQIKGLTDQIDTLKKSLDDVMQKNATLMADMEKMRKDAAKLEAARVAAPAVPVVPVASSSSQMASLPDSSAVETAVKEEDKPVVKKAKAKSTESKPRKKVASKKSKPSTLVLRAATPSAAWVSPDANSAELKRVVIGETLPGYGKITEIRQNGDVWEVVGTSSTLR